MHAILRRIGIKKAVIISLAIITVLGLSIRTYRFHDWLRFNADQSRDAGIVSDVLDGKIALPLYGPKAGGTEFRLGPAFYHFEIFSAWLFGNRPDVMAYPDLFFSILTIPLLYIYLRRRFGMRISLSLTFLYAVSFYTVKYSRFAWNPNSLPFWSLSFLLGFQKLSEGAPSGGKRWWFWPAVTGVALGVVVQLHTLALVAFPTMAVLSFAYLALIRKRDIRKPLAVVFLIAVAWNATQAYGEFRTGGENTRAFMSGVGTKEKKGSGMARNAIKEAVCYTDANVYVLSSRDRSDTCEIKGITKGSGAVVSLLGLIFMIGGIAHSIRSVLRERDERRAFFTLQFLSVMTLFALTLLPLANEISMRFFLVMTFMPFVFLGMWIEFLAERLPKPAAMIISGIVIVSLVMMNAVSIGRSFVEYAGYATLSGGGMDNVTLKEVEQASAFIVANAGDSDSAYLVGDAKYLFKAQKSIDYLTRRVGIRVLQPGKKTTEGVPVFLVDNSDKADEILAAGHVEAYGVLGRFTIFKREL
ncbi:MAG TPA: glycosyltransferase family 39 protein [Candidatus Fimivivens sp.]|nr:glycosyltransferase family 39 protein [Candidatus Fimivivens sp.]